MAYEVKLYKAIATEIGLYLRRGKYDRILQNLAKEFLPSGSGFDSGTLIDLERSNPEKLVFLTGFHHMSADGVYTKWTKHIVTVTPSLQYGITVTVSGRNYNDIKSHIHDSFYSALLATVEKKLDTDLNAIYS